ncbi:hypothetical protein, partial [Bosea sp. (in: a-proteobacteria)]|uniref:hypothetical protein n=1 Tax=Bosea sp. (in: a-proteobacteria) TaxID=1871050 RepID=UPI0031FEB252
WLLDHFPVSIQGAAHEVGLVERDMCEVRDEGGNARPLALLIAVRNTRSHLVPNEIERRMRAGDVDRIVQRRKRHGPIIMFRWSPSRTAGLCNPSILRRWRAFF